MKILLCAGLMIIITAGRLRAQQACQFYDRLINEAKAYGRAHKYDSAQLKLASAGHCPGKGAEISRIWQDILTGNNAPKIISDPSPIETSVTGKTRTDPEAWSIVALNKRDRQLVRELSRQDSAALMLDVAKLTKSNRKGTVDSLLAFFRFLDKAKSWDTTYWRCARVDLKLTAASRFPTDQTGALPLFSLRLMDYMYFSSLLDLELGMKMLPANSQEKYKPKVAAVFKEIEARRRESLQGFQMPDTIKGLPTNTLFAQQVSDGRDFTWGYHDYTDYKKVQVRYLSMSIPDFSVITDSTLLLADTGMFYNIAAAAGDYKYRVGRRIDYRLKPNKIEYRHIDYHTPEIKTLMDSSGNTLIDLSGYSSTSFFFSPDGSHLTTWNDDPKSGGSKLSLLDISKKAVVPLQNSNPAPTESFSSDSKKIAYYNQLKQVIYIADMSGNELDEIPGAETGIDSIENIDYTGGDRYLKVNNGDTISLFDLGSRKIVQQFSKSLVSDLVISADGQSVLLTCHTAYSIGKDDYKESFGIVTDIGFHVKARLYSDCGNFFFSPGGDYVIGYNDYAIMRWGIGRLSAEPEMTTCLSLEEMIKYKCLPLARWPEVIDADLMEKGARAFKDLAQDENDPGVKRLYYRLSSDLFYQLANGNSRNMRWERILFFYDWYNWEERRMGHRDFGTQFVRAMTAVKDFERYSNTPDSLYPEHIFYTAYGNMLLENLYDSMGIFNHDFVDLTEREVGLRCQVFARDPENTDNNDYLTMAFQRLSAVCDTLGSRDLQHGHYQQRLAIFSKEERLVAPNVGQLPDSFGLKDIYINTLAQLAPSFLYIYAAHPAGTRHLLDSALYYAEKALALSPGRSDSAKLLVIEARAYLLQPDGLEKSLALYRQVRKQFTSFSTETMLNQLVYLREAGWKRTPAMERVEELLKSKDK